MSTRSATRDLRRAPRIEVMTRVKGQLIAVDTPIVVHDLSRTGFGVVSQRPFAAGETLDFRLSGEGGTTITVTARAVHTRPMPANPGLHMSGFAFIPGRLTGRVPQVLIDELIATVAAPGVPCF